MVQLCYQFILQIRSHTHICLQCFDAVCWASGRDTASKYNIC